MRQPPQIIEVSWGNMRFHYKYNNALPCFKQLAKHAYMINLGYFYIMTNAHHTVLYCGATNDLYKRVLEHKNKTFSKSFSARYNVEKLVYFEVFSLVNDAFNREKKIKGGSRKKKIDLIESINPEWKDLSEMFASGSGEELIRIKKFFRY